MINYENISAVVRELRRKYGNLSALQLCKALGIDIKYHPMGTSQDSMRSFVLKSSRSYTIMLNSDLTEKTKKIVLFHEIGHVVLNHFDCLGVNAFHEFDLYLTSQTEIEANCFAAEYLMQTEETMEFVHDGRTPENIAGEMDVPMEIVDFKFRMLKYFELINKNYDFRYGSKCMGKIDCGKGYEDYYN